MSRKPKLDLNNRAAKTGMIGRPLKNHYEIKRFTAYRLTRQR
jgi:hypothetical protein